VRARFPAIGGAMLLVVGLIGGCSADTGTAPMVSPSSSSSPVDPPTKQVVTSGTSSAMSEASRRTPAMSEGPSKSTGAITTSAAGGSRTSASPTASARPSAATSSPGPTNTARPATTTADAGPASATAGPQPSFGLSAQDAAERQAIAEAWVKFWDVVVVAPSKPASQRRGLLEQVAVNPFLDRELASDADYDRAGKSTYGKVGHRLYWGPPPIDGTADIGDCMDLSKFGDFDVRKQEKLTYGSPRRDFRGTLKKVDGRWLVSEFQIWVDITC
jgi:hypothetical protein